MHPRTSCPPQSPREPDTALDRGPYTRGMKLSCRAPPPFPSLTGRSRSRWATPTMPHMLGVPVRLVHGTSGERADELAEASINPSEDGVKHLEWAVERVLDGSGRDRLRIQVPKHDDRAVDHAKTLGELTSLIRIHDEHQIDIPQVHRQNESRAVSTQIHPPLRGTREGRPRHRTIRADKAGRSDAGRSSPEEPPQNAFPVGAAHDVPVAHDENLVGVLASEARQRPAPPHAVKQTVGQVPERPEDGPQSWDRSRCGRGWARESHGRREVRSGP